MGIDLRDATPLYQQIIKDLKSKINTGELKIGGQVPSQHQMAKEYDVSLITVKKALAEMIREGVLFSRVGKGTYVARKPIKVDFSGNITFGLVLRDLKNPYFSRIVESIEEKVSHYGGNLLLATSSNRAEKEESQILHYRRIGVHGLLIASMTRQYRASPALRELHDDHFPYVVVSYIVDRDINYVGTDHELGAFLAGKHLIGLGYQRIGYINGEPGNILGEVRKQGFLKALKKYRKIFEERFEFRLRLRGGWLDYESGYEIGQKFAKLTDRPEAMFVYNDLSALGFEKALSDQGILVPNDVAIVGFDNIKEGATAKPPLTTVHQPTEKIGPIAVDMLLNKIKGEPVESRVTLKPHLIVRESCGAKVLKKLASKDIIA